MNIFLEFFKHDGDEAFVTCVTRASLAAPGRVSWDCRGTDHAAATRGQSRGGALGCNAWSLSLFSRAAWIEGRRRSLCVRDSCTGAWRDAQARTAGHGNWRGGRAVEGARLESVYTSKAYRGFESHPLRQPTPSASGGRPLSASCQGHADPTLSRVERQRCLLAGLKCRRASAASARRRRRTARGRSGRSGSRRSHRHR